MIGLVGSTVLVTGHTGFKGSWASLWLESIGAHVCGLSLEAEPESLFDRARLSGRWPEVFGDIRDQKVVETAMDKLQPELILHMAAQPLVRRSFREPLQTWATNVMGTAHILQSALRTPSLRGVVVVTTDKVYANVGQIWGYREGDALGGTDPYSASKAATELVVNSWLAVAETQGPQLVSVRAGNVIGGGDFAEDRLLPDLIRGFRSKRPVRIRNPKSTRPWQHVLDPLRGYLMILDRISNGEEVPRTVNFGPAPADSLPVDEVCDIAVGAWGSGAAWIQEQSEGPSEARQLALDPTLAQVALGWRPQLSTKESVEWTIDWWRAVWRGQSPRDRCLEELDWYGKRAEDSLKC